MARGGRLNVVGFPCLVSIGLISYPLYLLHWPLLSYLGMIKAGSPTSLETTAAIGSALVLAWLTYRFIEQPIQRRRLRPLLVSLPLVSISVVALVTIAGTGLAFRFPPEIRAIGRRQHDRQVESALEPVAKAAGADYLSALRAMCTIEGCLTRTGPSGSDLLGVDTTHLSRRGSIYLMGALSKQIILD